MNTKNPILLSEHAFGVAIKYGYFTAEQAKEYRYTSTHTTNERTTHYFAHEETGQPLAVPS